MFLIFQLHRILSPFRGFFSLETQLFLLSAYNNDYLTLSWSKIIIKRVHQTGWMQNDIGANKISKEKCHISHFDTCRRLWRYTFIFCTHCSQLHAGKQRGQINTATRGALQRDRLMGRSSLYPPSEGRCPLTSVDGVGGICLKASRDKCSPLIPSSKANM